MMKPSELKQYEFKSAGRNAYKADDVDSFFGEVLVNYEKMYRENSELFKRVSLLAERLESYKNDEAEIKQAVLSAQKAADIIVKDAENSVADAKQEAEAILAAAKGEADIIKSDAEKQAVADSELLLSIARDKAEDIMNKAKEEAHGILIAANDSASDTVGAATRTITSESIHYDMLKKEVSEFRASILAQYKAHIELISKLPELAVEEASKIEAVAEDTSASEQEKANTEESGVVPDFSQSESGVLEFVENADEDIDSANGDEIELSENFVEIPVNSEVASDDALSVEEENTDDTFADNTFVAERNSGTPADIPISKGFSVTSTDFDFDGFEDDTANDGAYSESIADDVPSGDDEQPSNESDGDNEDYDDEDDSDSVSSFFDSIESIDSDEPEETPKKGKKGFFGKWK